MRFVMQLDGSQPFYSNIYRQTDKQPRLIRAQSVLSGYPRLVMEPAGMVVIALMAYLLVLQGGSWAIPMLGTQHWGCSGCCRWPRRFMRLGNHPQYQEQPYSTAGAIGSTAAGRCHAPRPAPGNAPEHSDGRRTLSLRS